MYVSIDNVIPREGRDQGINAIKMLILNIEEGWGTPPVSLCHHSLILPDVIYYFTFNILFSGEGGGVS